MHTLPDVKSAIVCITILHYGASRFALKRYVRHGKPENISRRGGAVCAYNIQAHSTMSIRI